MWVTTSLKAQQILLHAYKEWIAALILLAKDVWDANPAYYDPEEKKYAAKMLGLSEFAPLADKTKRYRYLQLLLHPDKNHDVPEKLLEKYISAGKLLVAPK